jgi:hypothetical protein
MCQKATGGFFGPYVDVQEFAWTRSAPKYFQSSQAVQRGFCDICGTPLSFESHGQIGISIGALDNPELAPPTTQLGWPEKLSYVDQLGHLPEWRDPATGKNAVDSFEDVVSRQQPDDGSE